MNALAKSLEHLRETQGFLERLSSDKFVSELDLKTQLCKLDDVQEFLASLESFCDDQPGRRYLLLPYTYKVIDES